MEKFLKFAFQETGVLQPIFTFTVVGDAEIPTQNRLDFQESNQQTLAEIKTRFLIGFAPQIGGGLGQQVRLLLGVEIFEQGSTGCDTSSRIAH